MPAFAPPRPIPALLLVALALGSTNTLHAQPLPPAGKVLHKTVKVGDLDIFYREAGP